MNQSKPDLIYSSPQSKIKDFSFDAQVVEVFPDMIKRSVPGYSTIIETIGRLSQQYVSNNSNIYDLGCSLGAATLAMRQNIQAKNCQIIAVDNSQAMIERCQMHINAFKGETPCHIIQQDILETVIEQASMVVLNFTLQFIDTNVRQQLINNIAKGLKKGGILVLSEKINHPEQACQQLLTELHHDFKRANGYSDLEIAQKRSALEQVMKPDSLASHFERFEQAGFSHATTWFQCFNFVSMVAIK